MFDYQDNLKRYGYRTSRGCILPIGLLDLADMMPASKILLGKDPDTGLYDVSKVCITYTSIKDGISVFNEKLTDFNLLTETVKYDTKEIDEHLTPDGQKLFVASELLLRLKELKADYNFTSPIVTDEVVDRLATGLMRNTGREPKYFIEITRFTCAVLQPDCFQSVSTKHPTTGQMYGTVVITRPEGIFKGVLDGRV